MISHRFASDYAEMRCAMIFFEGERVRAGPGKTCPRNVATTTRGPAKYTTSSCKAQAPTQLLEKCYSGATRPDGVTGVSTYAIADASQIQAISIT